MFDLSFPSCLSLSTFLFSLSFLKGASGVNSPTDCLPRVHYVITPSLLRHREAADLAVPSEREQLVQHVRIECREHFLDLVSASEMHSRLIHNFPGTGRSHAVLRRIYAMNSETFGCKSERVTYASRYRIGPASDLL